MYQNSVTSSSHPATGVDNTATRSSYNTTRTCKLILLYVSYSNISLENLAFDQKMTRFYIPTTFPSFQFSKVKSAYEPIVAHQPGAYPGFCSMKQLGVFLLPPGWDASPSQGNPPPLPNIKFAVTRLYTPGWWEAMRVKCLAQVHNKCHWRRLELRPLNLDLKCTYQVNSCWFVLNGCWQISY